MKHAFVPRALQHAVVRPDATEGDPDHTYALESAATIAENERPTVRRMTVALRLFDEDASD